jgi:hypothetical protein
VEEIVAQLTRQPPVAEGRTEPAVAVAEEPTTTEAEEEAPAEAGLVDIASILGALLTVYFGTPSMFITLWFGFDYGTNPPLGTLII